MTQFSHGAAQVQYNRILQNTLACIKETGPDVIKQYVFMLNSAKHEIFTANKYENANYFSSYFYIY